MNICPKRKKNDYLPQTSNCPKRLSAPNVYLPSICPKRLSAQCNLQFTRVKLFILTNRQIDSFKFPSPDQLPRARTLAIFFPPCLGRTLMAHGSCGAKAPPPPHAQEKRGSKCLPSEILPPTTGMRSTPPISPSAGEIMTPPSHAADPLLCALLCCGPF